MHRENNLEEDPIGRLILRIALQSMLAQFVNVLYSIVDRMYIGNIPMTENLSLAGLGVCSPIITMIGSVASLVGIRGAPLLSISMGEKNLTRAKNYYGKLLFNAHCAICCNYCYHVSHQETDAFVIRSK